MAYQVDEQGSYWNRTLEGSNVGLTAKNAYMMTYMCGYECGTDNSSSWKRSSTSFDPQWRNQTETYYYYITNVSEIPPVINGCDGDFASRSGLDADIESSSGSEGYLQVMHTW